MRHLLILVVTCVLLEINVIATEILDAARKSAATGKTVTLPRGK